MPDLDSPNAEAAEKRSIGLYISMPPIYIFLLGSLIGFVVKAFQA